MGGSRKIKLIWDFRGQGSEQTAKHHEKHLKEYITATQIGPNITGYQRLGDLHSLAFMVVEEHQMLQIRDTLKPHRAELYIQSTP